MVHDNELGLRGGLAETVEEAILIEHALASHALIGGGRDGIPQGVVVLEPVELCAISELRPVDPLLKSAPNVIELLSQQERLKEVLVVAITA
jgi:hypothetical protein